MKKKLLVSVFFGCMLIVPPCLMAGSSYVSDFQKLYPRATKLDSCAVCHPVTPSLNSYGAAFDAKHRSGVTAAQAFTKIETADSDGDGFTNLTEITANSFPGDMNSSPASLLFVDNFSNATATAIPNWSKVSGTWIGNGKVLSSSDLTVNRVLANKASLASFSSGSIQSRILLKKGTTATTAPSAHIVFGHVDNQHYRYIRVTATKVIIGQMGADAGGVAGVKASANYSTPLSTWHDFRVVITAAGVVRVYADKATTLLVSYAFTTPAPGKVGYYASKSSTSFDNFSVSQ